MNYLASPYTGTQHEMRKRYGLALRATASLIAEKIWTYSPIVHCHEMAVLYNMPRDIDFWREYDTDTVHTCRELYVLQIPGWQESAGVAYEMRLAEKYNKPIRYLERHKNKLLICNAPAHEHGGIIRAVSLIS